MGKKKKAEKPSKKELRKIAEKEAQRKADKKRKGHEKAQKKAKVKTDRPTESAPASASGVAPSDERHPHLQHLDRVAELQAVLESDHSSKKERKAAKAELDEMRANGERLQAEKDARDQIDAEIKARLSEKRAARAVATDGSEAGTPERTAKMQADTAARQAAIMPEGVSAGDGLPRYAVMTDGDVVEVVPSTPAPEPETFAKPSEAQRWEDNTNGLGQYKVKRPSDGKEVGYTRVTTYIDALEDKTALTQWKLRVLLEGVAAAEEPDEDGKSDPVTARVRDLVHRRDVAIAKARKADRKGKLVVGQLATIIDGAWSDFKKAMNALADEVFEIGGGREKAQKGTDLHALCDLHDAEGIDAVQDLLDAGKITPADFADVRAYAAAMKSIGAKIVESELIVADHDRKVAGRLDRIVLARLPEVRDPKSGEVIRPADSRARRYVADIKTGRVDMGTGKIAQQIERYAVSEAYDPETGESKPHGANRTTGLLIHVPAGSGTATVHIVDLATGKAGNDLVAKVREYRNQARRAIRLDVDLAAAATATSEEEEKEA